MQVKKLWSVYWSGKTMISKIKEIYEYREMIASMIRRDLRGRYKASVLGFLWTFLNPLFQLFIYTMVFSVIMRANIEDFYIYLFIGLVPWNFFSASLAGGASCVVAQENLIKKIYFPRLVLPITYVTSALVNMLLTFIIIFVVLIFSGHGINVLALCFLPIVFLVEYVLALGICMLTSALTVYFRDLEYILNILAMAWMYLSPIMYTTEMVPENLRSIFKLNPLTAIIEAYHEILYYKMIPQISTLGSAIIWGIVFLIVGVFTFEKLQKNFVEEL